MYITDNNTSNMFIIPNPSDPENLKMYLLENLLGTNKSLLGLPTFATFYISTSSSLIPNDVCKNTLLDLNINITNGEGSETYNKIKIDFGDGTILEKSLNSANENNFRIITDPITGDKEIIVTYFYINGGNYPIRISILDFNNNELLETINSQIAKINTCYLKVNPHVRINL